MADSLNSAKNAFSSIGASQGAGGEPFVGFVLQNRLGWDADDFIECFAKDWGVELEVLPDESTGAEPVFAATLPGTQASIFITEIPAPIPPEALREAAGENYLWREGVAAVKSTVSHLVVMASGKARRETLALLFVRAAATILDNESAVGFLDCDVVFEPQNYRELALEAKNRPLPTLNLFWVGLSRHGEGFAAWTSGLARFGKPEMEVTQADVDPGELRELLINICAYVLEDDVTMKSGETLGYTPEQKLRLERAPSSFFPGMEVLRIVFKPGEQIDETARA